MQELSGKTAFITGGASGIGFGMAQAFVDAGMNVMVSDIRGDHIDAATSFFAERQVRNVRFVKLDVTDREAFARAADQTEAEFGKIHVVCNNAGMGLGGSFKETTFDDWDWGIDVLLKGAINGTLTMLPRILRHGEGGHIVNTGSGAGLIPGGSIYPSCKAAVLMLSECMQMDLEKDNIGVTALLPGLIKSNIHQSGRTRPDKYRKNTQALAREAEAEKRQVADAWMDAKTCGELVVQAIRDNRLYLFTHVEYKPFIEARFKRILDAFPDQKPNPEITEWVMRLGGRRLPKS